MVCGSSLSVIPNTDIQTNRQTYKRRDRHIDIKTWEQEKPKEENFNGEKEKPKEETPAV